MTADEFVGAIKRVGSNPADATKKAVYDAWAAVKLRPAPAFEHPPDPVLDLMARYDLSAVKFWQFEFKKGVPETWDDSWHVAQKATSDYYVDGGQVLKMYYKEAHPGPTGLTSSQFLDVLVLYARMIAATPANPPPEKLDAMLAGYACKALVISPEARCLDWFGESRAEFLERKRPVPLSIQIYLPGSLLRSVVGYAISEPDPDVNADETVFPFLRKAAARLVPKWTRSVRRFEEKSVWCRGELGGEDVLDGEMKVGTKKQHIHVRYRYSEPEQEMFPTSRRELRKYVLCGLPEGWWLGVQVDRQWRAGRLECAGLYFDATTPAEIHPDLESLVRAAFEQGAQWPNRTRTGKRKPPPSSSSSLRLD
jgi:hypothetical protein